MEENSKSVKLVGFWVSLFVQRVRWALKLKEINYEYIEEDIHNKTPRLSQLNPIYSKVPILIHDEKPLPDSFVILEYIDEMWKNNPLLPQDPYERAKVRFWARFHDQKVLEGGWLALCTGDEKQDEAVKSTIAALENIENKIKGKKFFGGDKIGYLDLIIGFVSYMLPVWEEVASVKFLDPLKFPGIIAWKNNFLEDSVIKGELLTSKEEMISYYQWRRRELFPVYAAFFSKASEEASAIHDELSETNRFD